MKLIRFAAAVLMAASLAIAPASAQYTTHIAPASRSATVGTTAVTLMPANSLRSGFSVQNQSASATCYLSTIGTATQDQNSLMLAAGAYYESTAGWVATGAVSVVCSGASTPVFAREW